MLLRSNFSFKKDVFTYKYDFVFTPLSSSWVWWPTAIWRRRARRRKRPWSTKSECCWRLVHSLTGPKQQHRERSQAYCVSCCDSSGIIWTCQSPAEVSRQRAQKPGRRSAHVWDPGRQRDPAGSGGQGIRDQMKTGDAAATVGVKLRGRGLDCLAQGWRKKGPSGPAVTSLHVSTLSCQSLATFKRPEK